MSPPALPPTHTHTHLTTTLAPSTALTHLSSYLALTAQNPHLHPDSYLSSTGIQFPLHAGPQGGLALHHLRRIAAGLRGENLGAETGEALKAFGEELEVELPAGDDSRLDSLISARTQGKKRKREREREREIAEWAETSSQAGAQELESFVNTPVHYSSASASGLWDGAQGLEEYEAEQEVLVGEVGGEEREGAVVVRQGGEAPGLVVGGEGARTGEEKAARKAAKKARRLEEKREKGRMGKG